MKAPTFPHSVPEQRAARAHVVQQWVRWGDAERARHEADELIERSAPAEGDLIVLCEMFATGYRVDVPKDWSDAEASKTGEWLSSVARRRRCVVMGGRVVRDSEGMLRNVVSVYDQTGHLCDAGKAHGFSPAGEDRRFAPAREITLVRWARVGLLVQVAVCYDLRFPELFEAGQRAGAEVVVVPAAWPVPRIEHWRTLLRARAIEQQVYVIGCNASGEAPAALPPRTESTQAQYGGRSMVINPRGEVLAEAGESEATVLSVPIDPEAVRGWRTKFPAIRDRRLPLPPVRICG